MKFEKAKVGMLVSVTGKYSSIFPNGAKVIEKDNTDNSIKIEEMKTGRKMWFFDYGVKYSLKDIHPLSNCY